MTAPTTRRGRDHRRQAGPTRAGAAMTTREPIRGEELSAYWRRLNRVMDEVLAAHRERTLVLERSEGADTAGTARPAAAGREGGER